MKRFISALLAILFFATPAMADISKKKAADMLYNATVAVLYSGNEPGCSASKIGPGTFLTAKHCVSPEMRLRTKSGQLLTPRSVHMGLERKTDGKRYEDWAIVYTDQDDTSTFVLPIGCYAPVYLGLDVAYGGYPSPTKYSLAFGNILTIGPLYSRGNNADYGMDIAASPGASGSPVISMETGEIIGILTEGIFSERSGFWAIGFESIKNLDVCGLPPTPITNAGSGLPSTDTTDAKTK